MTADPEAVTRAREALRSVLVEWFGASLAADSATDYETFETGAAAARIWVDASLLDAVTRVLASPPDDRLAEADAKVERVEAEAQRWAEDETLDPAYSLWILAALSGGDATADPDTPTYDRLMINTPRQNRDHFPDTPTADAPADTDLREQIARWLSERVGITLFAADYAAKVLLPLVREQVEAARRDALNQTADEIRRSPWALANHEQMLRDLAARGETRQP